MPKQRSGLVPGAVAGLLAMLAGAAAYGAVIGITKYEIGLATVGVGALVGLAITAVKPTSPLLPPLAAVLGLAGAALGQVAGAALLLLELARQEGMAITYATAAAEIVHGFDALIGEDPESLLFWAVAAATAFVVVNRRTPTPATNRTGTVHGTHRPGTPHITKQPAPPHITAPTSASEPWTASARAHGGTGNAEQRTRSMDTADRTGTTDQALQGTPAHQKTPVPGPQDTHGHKLD